MTSTHIAWRYNIAEIDASRDDGPISGVAEQTMPSLLQLGMAWFPEQPGGLDRYYYELLGAIADLNQPVSGLVAGSDAVEAGSEGRVKAFAGLHAPILMRWHGLRHGVAEALASESPPALCAAHFALYAFPILDLIKSMPLVVHFHGPWAAESRCEGAGRLTTIAKHWLERRVYRRADRCIALSRAFADILASSYGVEERRIRVIPGGVNAHRFRPSGSREQARAILSWPTDRPIVLCVRRLAHRMGLQNLIAAVSELRRGVPDVLVLIAGRGSLESELREQIKFAGLADHVRLLGFAPDQDLPAMYRAADISIVPSQALEGFGLTVVESLAAGTPVLVTPVGGLPEVIQDLSPQLILKDASASAIAAGLTASLRGELELPSSETCQAFASERYDWPRIASRVLQVYREAASS